MSSFSAIPPASARWEMKERRASSTQASAPAHLGGAGNYNSRHASRRPPSFSLLIGAEGERVAGGAGAGGRCGAPIGESYGFCLPFTSRDDQGAPGARGFSSGAVQGRAPARPASLVRAPGGRPRPRGGAALVLAVLSLGCAAPGGRRRVAGSGVCPL